MSDDPDDLLLLAVEEAGHAVMVWLEGAVILEVTIVPTDEFAGRCFWGHKPPVVTDHVKEARTWLAGPAATMIFTDSDQFWNGDAHDIDEAACLLEGTGISWHQLLPRVRAELERDWPRVLRLTENLLAHQRLSGAEATAVIQGASLSPCLKRRGSSPHGSNSRRLTSLKG